MNQTRTTLCIMAIALALPVFGQGSRPRKSDRARQDEQVRAEIEARGNAIFNKELAGWRPTARNAATIPPGVGCVATDLSGVWRRHSGLEGAYLKLFPLGSGRFKVRFITYDCSGRWTLERKGVYRDGVLTLDRPVADSLDSPYRRLFTINTRTGVRLIPDVTVSMASKNGARSMRECPEVWTFGNQYRAVKAVPVAPKAKPSHISPPATPTMPRLL